MYSPFSNAVEEAPFFTFDCPVNGHSDAGAGDTVGKLGVACLGFFAAAVSVGLAREFVVTRTAPTVIPAYSVRSHGSVPFCCATRYRVAVITYFAK